MNCTLCGSSLLERIEPPKDKRSYYHCTYCNLILADPKHHLSVEHERKRYEFHQNSIEDEGYVQFLNTIIDKAKPYLNKGMSGCDYGCGPGPTLSKLLAIDGLTCYNYDPLFGYGHQRTSYDYIFSTECFEHFNNPAKEISKINSLLNPGGYLFIMTLQWSSLEKFIEWYYKMDETHVSFYHPDTFEFIAKSYSYDLLYNDLKRSIIIQKK